MAFVLRRVNAFSDSALRLGEVVGLSLLVPGALIWDALYYNSHSSSSVAPVGIALAIILAVGFDLLIWLAFALFLVSRSARRAAHELRSDHRVA